MFLTQTHEHHHRPPPAAATPSLEFDSELGVTNIEFVFNLDGDTTLSIAWEMVEQLELPKEDMTLIAELMDNVIIKMVPCWMPSSVRFSATLGSVKMSKCIAKVNCKLIGVRNNEEMTPLFLAALNGKKHAFLCLDDLCSQDDRYHYYRSNNGETVLHSAINGEFFDLAFQIICQYGDLVNYVPKKDCLHSMLWPPSPPPSKVDAALQGSTKSFTTVSTFVDELKLDKVREEEGKEKKPKLSENYQTCINIFVLFRDAFCVPFVVMRGLDAAGKTTILYKLHIGELLSTVPTIE
ncbi:unnamed protein product [Camellia sinensis]